jgi:hypothetical protein
MVGFLAFPTLWKYFTFKAASAALLERTKAAVAENPQLQPAWDIAMQDDVLTWAEAKVIIESAGGKVDPES